MNHPAQIVARTLLVLLLAEGAARVAEWIRPGAEDIAFDYAPYRMLRMIRAPWPLNREGFRAQEFEFYRDSFLIEFLGGSVCLGEGSNPGKPVPERMEDALREAGLARVRVLNLCQGGATSAQELAIFTQYGLRLEPQVVISFDGANDLMHPRPIGDDDAPNLPYRDAQMRAQFFGHHSGLAHLALARVASRLRRRIPTSIPADPVDAVGILDSYLYNLDLTRSLTESRGALYVVMLQPTLHFAKPWSAEEARMWERMRPRSGAEISRRAAALYVAVTPRLKLWASRSRIRAADLTRVFADTRDTVYTDSVHFSGERGYAMLFAEIRKQGLLDVIAQRYRMWERGAGRSSEVAWVR